jgi:hypothetical protein
MSPSLLCHRQSITDDTAFFRTLLCLFDSLEKDSTQEGFDARIYCEIIFSTNDTYQLILGDFWGTEVNGIQMIDNMDLNYCIKRNIGFYDYCPKDFLYGYKELKDSVRLLTIQNEWRKLRKIEVLEIEE